MVCGKCSGTPPRLIRLRILKCAKFLLESVVFSRKYQYGRANDNQLALPNSLLPMGWSVLCREKISFTSIFSFFMQLHFFLMWLLKAFHFNSDSNVLTFIFHCWVFWGIFFQILLALLSPSLFCFYVAIPQLLSVSILLPPFPIQFSSFLWSCLVHCPILILFPISLFHLANSFQPIFFAYYVLFLSI